MPKLDIHNTGHRIKGALRKLKKNKYPSSKQFKDIDRFIELAQLGKLGKKSGNHRVLSYIYNFNKLFNYFKKDLIEITEKEFEEFYKKLENNKIKRENGKSYKDSTKNELTKTLKKYLKWAYKGDKRYKINVGWFKDFKQVTEIPAITKEEAIKLATASKSLRDRALILFLFDSGCRIEETLNLKFSNLKVKQNDNGDYYVVDIKVSKTLPRKISIPICSAFLTDWIKVHPERDNPEAYIFPIRYDWARIMLNRLSKKVLGFKVTLHQLRHSSASFYCKKINNPFKFVYRYGWAVNSDMAKRYIDRSLLEEDAQEEIVDHIKQDKLLEQEKKIKTFEEYFKITSNAWLLIVEGLFKSGYKNKELSEAYNKIKSYRSFPLLINPPESFSKIRGVKNNPSDKVR